MNKKLLLSLVTLVGVSYVSSTFAATELGSWKVSNGVYDTHKIKGVKTALYILDNAKLKWDSTITFTFKTKNNKKLNNAFFVFDVKDNKNFKYVWAREWGNKWVIGTVENGVWEKGTVFKEDIKTNQDYNVKITIVWWTVTFYVKGQKRLVRHYPVYFNDKIWFVTDRGSSEFKNFKLVKNKDTFSKLDYEVNWWSTDLTGTPLDKAIQIIKNEPRLAKKVPTIDRMEAVYCIKSYWYCRRWKIYSRWNEKIKHIYVWTLP